MHFISVGVAKAPKEFNDDNMNGFSKPVSSWMNAYDVKIRVYLCWCSYVIKEVVDIHLNVVDVCGR